MHVFLLILLALSMCHAKRYARYNLVGYFPKAVKRIVIMSDDDCAGKKWELKDQSGKSALAGTAGKSVCGKNDHTPFAYNHEIDVSALTTEGTFTFKMEGIKAFKITVSRNPYASVAQSNLRWLRAARAGSKDVLDRKPAHFGDSSCYVYRRKGDNNTDDWAEDAKGKKVNMLGGWYDGYVYTKYTLTAALTTYSLLRAYEVNPALFTKKYSKTGLNDLLDEAKWGCDYLCKTMPDDNEFIIEVGDFADNERGTLLPHEDPLDGKRPAYSIFSPNQMGNTAAALALGSAVFAKEGKKKDAEKYKAMAVKIFNKAVSKAAKAPAWLEKEWALYEDDKQYDNLLLAAAELFRLTNDRKYLTHAKKFAGLAKNSWWAAYSSAHLYAHQRLMDKVPDSKKYLLDDLNSFNSKASGSGNIWSSPQDYSLYHIYATIEVAAASLLYQMAATDKKYEKDALYMLDYVFGTNNWGLSFVSMPSIKKCVKNYYSQIYMLQTGLFPEGGIAVGPLDVKTHDDEASWCYFDPKKQKTYKFNTGKIKFFDHSDDYMCMRANTYGVADCIFLLSLATRIYGDAGVKEKERPRLVKAEKVTDDKEVHLRYNHLGYNPSRKKRIIVMAGEDIKGRTWAIMKATKKGKTKKVQSGSFGASVYGRGQHTPMPFNYIVDFSTLKEEGKYTFETKGAKKAKFIIKNDPYSWILEKPLRWMRAARCGSEDCVDHKVCHLGDSACVIHRRAGIRNNKWTIDPDKKKISGFGGWHDAGDYLKFSLTVGYTAYFLLRAYEVNPDIFAKKLSKTGLVDILDEAKWGLEFLMRCMPDSNEFIIMVGGLDDHNVGLRLPHNDKLDGRRPCISALSPTQMGYASAALAVGSGIFGKLGKKEDAKRYRDMAELIFRRAESKDAVAPAWFVDTLGLYDFYGDESKNDNMELAAAELYRLTGDKKYYDAAKKYSDKARSAGWRAWESVNMPAHLCFMENYSVVKNDLRVDLDGFLKNSKKRGNIWGLPQKYVWGGLYCYIGIAAAAMEFQMRTGDRKYESIARDMLDYTLGFNNWGICFVATKELPYTIRHPFSQVYTLQSGLFPTGAISEGPGEKRDWEKNKNWFSYDPNAQPTHKFNTEKGVFYDHNKDYMCMETTISGVADGIFMLALASRLYKD